MAEKTPPPLGPFTLTPQRILILVFGVLAVIFIVGALLGGVGNYQQLREAAQASSSAAQSASSSP